MCELSSSHHRSAQFCPSSADHIHRLSGNLPQFGTGSAGTGADGDGVHRGGCEDRKRRGIGIVASVRLLSCASGNALRNRRRSREVLPQHSCGSPASSTVSVTAVPITKQPRASFARKIDRQRRVVGKHQRFVQGVVPCESLARRGEADVPIMRERLEIERVLVAEGRIEARRDSCRSRQRFCPAKCRNSRSSRRCRLLA